MSSFPYRTMMLNILLSIITVVISIISCVFGLALTLSAIDGNQFWPSLVYASALWLYGVVMLFMLALSWYKPSYNQVTHTRNLGILIVGIVLVGCFDSARLSGQELSTLLVSSIAVYVAFFTIKRLALRQH